MSKLSKYLNLLNLSTVLRIDSFNFDVVTSFKFTEFFKQKIISNFLYYFFVLFFPLIFILKLDEPFRNDEIFIIISLFFQKFRFLSWE